MPSATETSQYDEFKSELCKSAASRAKYGGSEWLHETFNHLADRMEGQFGTTNGQINSGIQTLRHAARKVLSENIEDAISLGPAMGSPSFVNEVIGSAITIAQSGTDTLKADVSSRQR